MRRFCPLFVTSCQRTLYEKPFKCCIIRAKNLRIITGLEAMLPGLNTDNVLCLKSAIQVTAYLNISYQLACFHGRCNVNNAGNLLLLLLSLLLMLLLFLLLLLLFLKHWKKSRFIWTQRRCHWYKCKYTRRTRNMSAIKLYSLCVHQYMRIVKLPIKPFSVTLTYLSFSSMQW